MQGCEVVGWLCEVFDIIVICVVEVDEDIKWIDSVIDEQKKVVDEVNIILNLIVLILINDLMWIDIINCVVLQLQEQSQNVCICFE